MKSQSSALFSTSRRRHTRCSRDWSSDVCSSDLHDLTALGVPSLRRAARGDVAAQTLAAVAARLVVARSRARARAGYPAGPVALRFPERAAGEVIRAGPAPERQLEDLVRGSSEEHTSELQSP